MMDQRRALTIPFNVDKDNLVSWTSFAGCKRRSRGSPQKNGSMLFDRNLVFLEMTRRKPRLILTDVLETDQGKAYMKRIKPSCTLGNHAQELNTRRESGRCRDRRSSQRETRKDKNNSVTHKCNQKKTASSSTQRSGFRRRSQNVDDEVDTEESKDIEEVIIGKDNRDDLKFAEVVDCGLSVSWEPAEDTASCDEFPPASIKDRLTDPEKDVHDSLKRKRKDAASHCNGTGSPKRHRESVLRLTGEDGRDGGLASTHIRLEESGEDGDLESLDRTIVQFTVGADDRTELLVPVNFPNLMAEDAAGTPRRSLSSSQDNMATPTEPIVLSSDDEESGGVLQRRKSAANSPVTVGEALIQEQLSEEDVTKQLEASDIQVMRVVVDLPGLVEDPPILSVDYSFSMLHCGGYQGKANGDIMITDQRIFIPLKDADEQVEVTLTLERKDLRRYSVWEQHDLEDREFYFKGIEEPCPAAVLLLCVSQSAAAAVQRELIKFCVEQDQRRTTDEVSPFILLTLRHPVEGMEGALLRSLLDIDCLNSVAREKSFSGADKVCCFEDFQTPVLSLDDSINLIRRSRLGSHLLCLLDLETIDPTFNTDQDEPHLDAEENTPLNMQPAVESQKETELDLKTVTEPDMGMLLKPEEDQKELDHLPEKTKESTPVYTLCHRRTQGSYFTTLCRPDSSLTKFKHQGLARRLIQFPPPPLKGGITVTMEDLRCLDSGHFLNDVIIDFYLKYLLQNVSAAVAERSHIFSSFFYKQLTRRDNASEGVTSDSCQRQRRHHRVRTWTRHVDIFKKDFLFVPVNQEAHWYLVVICFPGLDEPKSEAWSHPNEKIQEQDVAQGSESPNDNTEKPPTPPTFNHSDSVDTGTEKPKEEPTKDPLPDPVNCTERTFQKKTVSKRPCILIMDSLKLSLHERVFKLLREYLQSEWEVRRGSSRDFGPDQMQSSHCKVPLQDNSSDCGLYLLQYVESFLKDPVVHFDLPLQLQRWFPRQQVRRKRDEIRDLVLNLYRHQNLDSNR